MLVIEDRSYWEKIARRFLKHVAVIDDETSCWLWTASCRSDGYGQFNIEGVIYASHKVAAVLSGLVLGETDLVLHTCDVRPCVRPEHLYLGTYVDNMMDRKQRGSWKYSKKVVEEVRRLRSEGLTYPELSRVFGMSISHAHRIATRECW